MKRDILFLVVSCALGFLGGLAWNNDKGEKVIEVRYEQLPSKRDTVWNNTTHLVHQTINNTDTIWEVIKEDTSELRRLFDDYYMLNDYKYSFGSDTTGIFDLEVGVTKNRIAYVFSDIEPRMKVVKETTYLNPKFQLFGVLGTDVTFNGFSAGFNGIINNKWSVGANYIRSHGKNIGTITVGAKIL